MGASSNVFVKSAVILIFLGALTVNGYENDDIVFDQDGRNSAIEIPLIERQHDQSFFQRVKRGLFDWWVPPTTTPTPDTKTSDGENQTTQTSYDQTEGPDVMLNTLINEPKKRTSRESGEENAVDQTSPKVEDNDIGNTAAAYPLPIYPTTDDEDLEGSGDVEGSSDDDDLWGTVGTEVPNRPSGQPQYYRITLTVIEPYKREYSDRQSKEYQELAGNVSKVIEDLYRQKLPNFEHSANVVMISPLPDPFSTQVTIDVGSLFDDGFSDELEIRQILEKQLQLHSLGSLQVGPDGFTFRKVQAAGGPECEENSEMRCRDGTCIPLSQRCDGISQCHDDSDELDCPKETSTELSGGQDPTKEDEDDKYKPSSSEDTFGQPRTFHSFNNFTTPLDSDSRVKCRGDDFPLPCKDGSRHICSVQNCDGIRDCDDGSDEEGCGSSGCGDGEFACDVTRCILDSKRCDFTEDCKDGSDEHSCIYPACNPGEFKCRNSQCITGSLRCNGVADCRDGSDESNCPCKDDEFECTPLYCIPLDKRCDGTNDCSNRRDEKDCDSNPRCRDGEFTCDDGSCVSLRLRCDGHSDCSDRSDERNCTVITCNSNQFRCQDGTCLDIERRCDNYPDCSNGEDELQCGGAGCGPSAFSCNDGNCVPYRFQCNGIKECNDGSDELDCVKGKTGRQDVHDAGRHNLQNGLLTNVRAKNRTGKRKNRRQRFRVARRRNKKGKHNHSIRRKVTSNSFDIPSAGKIENPIIAAYPELKSELEKFTHISHSGEEDSPNNNWEFIDTIIDQKRSLETKALQSLLNHKKLEEVFKETRKVADLLYDYDKLDVEDYDIDTDDAENANNNKNYRYETTTLETRAPTRNGHENDKIKPSNHKRVNLMTQAKIPVTPKSDTSSAVSKNHSTRNNRAKFMRLGGTMHSVIANRSRNEVIPPTKAKIRILSDSKRRENELDKIFADAKKIDDPVDMAYPDLGEDTYNYYEGQYDEDDESDTIPGDNSEEYEYEDDYDDNRLNQNLSADTIGTSKSKNGSVVTAADFAPCPSMDFTCEDNSCISKTKVCDGIEDCPNAEDELHCGATMSQQKWNLTTQMPTSFETLETVQTNSPEKHVRTSPKSKLGKPRHKSVYDKYKSQWGVTKKISEENTDKPHTYNPKKDVEIISNRTIFNNSSKSGGKLYRYTKDVKVPDPSDVVNKILEAKRLAESFSSTPTPTAKNKVESYDDDMKMTHEENTSTQSNEKTTPPSTSVTPSTMTIKVESHRDYTMMIHEENTSIQSEKTTPSSTSVVPATTKIKGKSYRDYFKTLHEENTSIQSEKTTASSSSVVPATTKIKGKSYRDYFKTLHEENTSTSSDESTTSPKTFSIFPTESDVEIIKDSKEIFNKTTDALIKEIKGANKKTNKANVANNENKKRRKGTAFWRNLKASKKPELYKDLKIESGLYVKKGKVNLPKRLEFDDVPDQIKNETVIKSVKELLKAHDGSEDCAKCASFWEKKYVELLDDKSTKTNQTKTFSFENNNNQNVDSGLDVSSENCTELNAKAYPTPDDPQDSESRETLIAPTKCKNTSNISQPTSRKKEQEDFEIITTERTRKKNNKHNGHKNKNGKKNKSNGKKPKNKNGKRKKDKKNKKTTHGKILTTTPVDEPISMNTDGTTEGLNLGTRPEDNSTQITFGWTESTEDDQTTGVDDTTTIAYESDYGSSKGGVDTVANTPNDATTSAPIVKTESATCHWLWGCNSDESNRSETTEQPETSDIFSPSTIKPCTSIDCSDSENDETSELNTELSSTIPYASTTSDYLASISSTQETPISTGAAEEKDSDSMESSVSKEKRSKFDDKSESPEIIVDYKEDDTIFREITTSQPTDRLEGEIDMEGEISEEVLLINATLNILKGKQNEESSTNTEIETGSNTIGWNSELDVKETSTRRYSSPTPIQFVSTTIKPFRLRCQVYQHNCDGSRCISMNNICDGVFHCRDSSDETYCPWRLWRMEKRYNYERCNDDQFPCDKTLCLEQGNICDGIRHCVDGTDEMGCDYWNAVKKALLRGNRAKYRERLTSTTEKQPTTTSQPRPLINQENQCHPELQFKCRDGRCIEDYQQCDGYEDCVYGEDEDNCLGFAPCPSMDFTCEDGSCIPKTKVCDGIDNCPRAEDELHCDRECTPTQFKCGSGGKCIEGIYRCDGHPDCPDHSDEDKCPGVSNENVTHTVTHTNAPPSRPWITERPGTRKECDPRTEMRCADGSQCILLRRKCDSVFDCFDNSDEADCGGCEPDEWKCASGECVTENARCDGKEHCPDGSDEIGCAECPAGTFRCNDGLCLDVKRLCDGRPHCRDGSDEINCQPGKFYCPDGQAPCDNGVCIDEKFLCDKNEDCLDGSDEARCPDTPQEPQTCARYQFTCRDGSCIPREAFCDGRPDCPDGDDEDCEHRIEASDKTSSGRHPESVQVFTDSTVALGVTGTETGPWSNQSAPRICTEGDFVCADGTCIPAAHRCDNFYDCRDFTDEQYCFECSSDEFQCRSGACIDNRRKCDSVINCDDGSDEEDCQPETPPAGRYCSADQFTCVRDRTCVHYSSRCNGIPECRDNSDEDGCDTEPRGGLDLKTRPSEQVIKENPAKQGREVVFQCRDEGSQRAKVRWLRGNGRPLPPGSRDINGRLEIPNIQMEHSGTYICEAVGYPPSTPGRQVTVQLEVEKLDLPVTRPSQVCKYDEATCSNGDCIPKSSVCNGKYDCTDGSDEMRCNPHGCEPNQFRCANKECVSKVWRCDGDKDCRDGTDEENCEPPPPGSPCRYDEYQCAKFDQCIPKSYHCDMERDCQDGSDEFGCSPVYITKPPPGMMTLHVGETMILTCSAVGVPIPEINWRLNWGHVPAKCYSTSQNGTGTLTCPDIQIADQGAYSCEALNHQGFVFAVPDTILVVDAEKGYCRPGTFNDAAQRPEECISCFCFGVSNTCKSANLFTYQLRPPFDRFRVVSVETLPVLRVLGEVSSQVAEVRPSGSYGADISAPYNNELTSYNVPYFAVPENYYGPSSLKSYGGYLKYTVSYTGDGRPNNSPDVILSGNGFVLVHRGAPVQPNTQNDRRVRFFYGDWYKNDRGQDIRATREEIMMVLAKIDHILIKAKYEDSPELQVSITDIVMDTAEDTNVGLGAASYVEECTCPTGYHGYSCESCAPGFIRRTSGAWLGECYLPPQPNDTCKEGFYGDPLRNIPCERCACPLTNPANQFARTCHLGAGRNPVCDCLPEYSGPQCQYCADGYVGNPRLPGGGKCERKVQCNPDGSLTPDADAEGKCRCKQYATGLLCDQCKANTFNLATKNQFGCISCFCMGITDRCTSSYWFRNEIRVPFTNSIRNFTLVESNTPNAKPISEGIQLDTTAREIVYSAFPNRGNTDVYYWQLPNIFLGNQITSYGGDLRYTVRYVPSPGGQSSRNNAADVELISANDIVLHYYSRETPESNTPQSFTVPLLEQYWQRIDGTQADREHLLMALADVEDIRIKATYTTHTDEAALSQVSLDIAEKYNTGKERAYEVEECSCPAGYRGLSCEDCAAGYTKGHGFYLGICEPCFCNGHSDQCDPETGICENCRNHTTGENCEFCEPGYQGDATRGGCFQSDGQRPEQCDCDPAGSESDQCVNGVCLCKGNVEGARCNRCRPSTFGLSADNIDGCNECYCSGVTNQCHESSLYIQPLPMWVSDAHHGFTLTDSSRLDVIDDGFIINEELNEIGYRFSNNRNRRLFWSLPATFTGNKVKSYAGKLTITQHITALPNSQILKDQDVLLIGNGITLFWTNPQEILPEIPMTYSVLLRESEWRRLSTAGPRRASRTDLMTVLSNLDAILVRASHSEGMTATYISDISLDSATENRKTHRATQIEACRCPQGYSGTSCETCAPGYYRDLTNRSVSILGSCNACPCNGHEESCDISGSGQIRCNCRSGYSGYYCQDIAELRVGLMPIKPQATKGSIVKFTCSYDHWDTLYIYLKLTHYYGLPLTSYEGVPGPLVTTNYGAYRVWNVRVGDNPCNVECLIVDRNGKELARISTTISTVDDSDQGQTLPPPVPQPKIEVTVQEKKFQIVQTGSTVRLHCSGRSVDNAPLRIKWEKEGTALSERSSDDYQGLLVIRDIRVSDSGIYVCRVTDGINFVFEKVSISVGGARPESPRAVIRPSYLQVKEGESVRFQCEATGHPEPEIEWVRIQGPMNPEARIYRGVLQIQAATRSDAAQYKCIARNEAGINEQTTILYVSENNDRPNPDIIPNKPPMINPTQWTGSAGDAVRLICARSNYHESVSWIRSGNLALPQSFSQRDGVLTIGNPTPTDSGIYICTAVSFQGTETSTSANVTIYPKRTHPSVRVEPERQTVSQGTEAEIRCIADRESGLQIKWVKYGEPSLGPNARQIGDTLKITSPQVSDRGVYICRASNSAGSYEASAIVEVTPRETPILELHPRDSQIVNLGGSADIQCRVTAGIPMPEVHWNREDGRQFSSNIQQLPGGLLRLTNVSVHDGGAYRCSASNTVGSTSAIARIEVQSLPIITVTPPGGLIYAKRGARVMLTCTAQGLPQPTVAWMKSRPGVAIYSFARRPEASRLSAVHEIMSMSPDDEGSYTCQAINAAGVTEERVQIRIEEDNSVGEGEPEEPDYNGGVRIPNDSLSVPAGGTVTIRCQVYGPTNGPRINIDWRRSDRRSLPVGSYVRDHSLTIENATREAAGEYVCLGIDPSGREVFRARAHVDVVSLPNIKLNPSRQTVRPGESPAIVCTATGDQPMTIEWDAIGRDLPYSVTKDRGVLQFNRITYTDAGKYVCKARNNAGIAEAVAEVLVSENTVEDPVIRAVDRDITTFPGSTVTLRCDVRPRSVIEWTKNGRPLSRNVRVGEDYIELTNVQREDGGTYTCQVRTSHGESNDYINLRVEEAQNSAVTIEPSQNVVNIGDMIDLRCTYTGTDNPRYHWTRPNHVDLPLNSLEHGNILRLSNIELSESGIYRCHVITQDGGNYDGEYNLIVQGGNDAPAIETKFVPYGKSLEMICRPNLDEPVDYQWSKLGGLLPQDTETYDNILKLTKVKAEDAGTYICKASNGHESTEVPTVLVVTGVVPNFHQAPKSWISLPPLPDSYLKFNIEVSFKPENYDGIILYNDETVDGTGDYIMLSLAGGYPEFQFDLGSGAAVIRADKPVSLGEWHTIKLLRSRKEGTMLVDGEGPYKVVNSGKKQGLDLKEPLYIGGVPDYNAINPQAHANTGFVGCISRLVLGDKSIDLIGEQTDSVGVTTCETCAENPCNNAGVCQEASTKNGYRCLCRAGYSGKHCDSTGQPCYPGACGDGKCVDKENGFECYCPHGKSGPRCELFTPNLNEPAFRDDRAYLGYPTPTAGRRLKLSMNFKPSDNGDGILMYCSQSEEGLGDFVALVIKDRYIEFRFDVGSGMAVIRSNHVVQPGTWTHVTLSRELRDGRISINGGQIFEGRSPGSARTMTLNTPLYIGGIDRRKITVNRNIGVDRNFHGCINELEMSAKNFGFLKSIIDSANVEDCSTFPVSNVTRPEPTTQQPTRPPTTSYDPCERKPCVHGVCQIVGDYDYSCTCDYGYVGRDCEKILKQCELLRPCQNGGSCMDQHGSYKCDCRLGFSGKDCEKKVDIIYDVAFKGDGWLELDRSVMPHEEENEVLCFEISTNKSNGLVMWHGQTPNDLSSDDYIALAIVDGYVEFQYDLGSGPAVMRVTAHRVDDGERHRIILKRKFSEGNIELDGEHMESGISYGLQQLLNVRGSVYLGGVPDWAMTYGRYNDGFSGCIYAMEVQDSAGIDIGSKAIRGKNVEPCTRARWIPSSLIFTDGDSDGFDDFVPPPPVNIIHPKPTANVATTNIKSIYVLVAVQNTIGFSIDVKLHSILRAVLCIVLVALANSYFE